MYHAHGQMFFGMRLPLWLRRTKRQAAFRRIQSWHPQRILLSHGYCFDGNADEVLARLISPN